MKTGTATLIIRPTVLTALLSLFIALLAAQSAQAQHVLDRARLGNYIEDITFVSNGPYANHVVAASGHEVYGAPVNSSPNAPPKKLFDLRQSGVVAGPRGIAYVESERLFALIDPSQRGTLFMVDHQGHAKGTRTIQYPGGFFPFHVEGLVYIPESSPVFPDHLVLVAIEQDFSMSRLEVIRRDGTVAAEILPASPLRESFLAAVAFKAPDKLLLGLDDGIWTIDFNGNIVSGPVVLSGTNFIEGLVQIGDGRIISTGGLAALRLFDQNLNRLPGDDKNFSLGLGYIQALGVAWNPDTNSHLVNVTTDGSPNTRQVISLTPALDSATQVIDLAGAGFLSPRALAYLPNEHLVAVAHLNGPRRILLFNSSGALVEQVTLSVNANIAAVEYIPVTNQFAARLAGEASKVKIFSRTGAFVREFDFAASGVANVASFAYFNPAHVTGGQFLIVTVGGRVLITDFNGNLLREFNCRDKLGVLQPAEVAAITTGAQAGAFSLVDSDNSEVIIFRLD